MQEMKKILSVLMIPALLFAMLACNAPPEANSSNAATEAPKEAQPEEKASEAPKSEASAAAPASDGAVVKVGVVGPMTGGAANLCQKINWGIQMATDDFNEAGGVKSMNGAKIELVFGDSTGKPDTGATEAERLIVQEKVDVILSTTQSAVSASVAPIAEKYKTPCILVTSVSNAILQNGYQYVFRFNHYGTGDAKATAGFVQSLPDVKKVAIVYEDTDYGKGLYQGLTDLLEGKMEIVISESYPQNNTDFSPLVNKLKAKQPDVVCLASYLNDAILLVKTMQEYKCNVPIAAAAGVYCNTEFIDAVGSASEYCTDINGIPFDLIEKKGADAIALNDKYKSKYSNGLDIDTFPGCGYTAMQVLFDALERAGSADKEKVQQALLTVDLPADSPALLLAPYDGIKTGEIDGMTNQNIYAQSIICQVQNGKAKVVYPENMRNEGTELIWPVPKWEDR